MTYKITLLFLCCLLCVGMMVLAASMKEAADNQSISMYREFGRMDPHACDDCLSHAICQQ